MGQIGYWYELAAEGKRLTKDIYLEDKQRE